MTGIKATIAVPEGANPGKVAAMRGLGAEVIFHGADFDTAREWIMGQAEAQHGRFVGPTEELLICGVGTYALEILEELPEVDTIIVPVGAGSGACGTSIVAKSINPKIEVIAAQSAQAPAMQLSWEAGKLVTAEMNTFAEGVGYYSTSGGNGIQYAGQDGIIRRNAFYQTNVGLGMLGFATSWCWRSGTS